MQCYLVAVNFYIMTRSFEEIASELQKDRVLLVGGAGFIGHNLAVGLSRGWCFRNGTR